MISVESVIKKVVFARLFEGEDLDATITSVSKKHGVNSGFFSLIGTLKRATLGFYKAGAYLEIEKSGPLEIVSCTGNISTKEDDSLAVHGHLIVSDGEGNTFGGHLLSNCVVDVTVELTLVDVEPGTLIRKFDAERGLHLWSF